MAHPYGGGAVQAMILIEAPFLVGSMLSSLLLGVVGAQTVYYFRKYPGDELYIKILVGSLLVLETIHQALVTESAHYFYVVSKVPEKVQGIFIIRKGFGVAFGIHVIVTTMVQIFYSRRLWMIAPKCRFRQVILAVILSLSSLQLIAGFGIVVLIIIHPSVATIHELARNIFFSIELSAAMLADIIITSSLVYYLNTSRQGFRSSEEYINRWIYITINTGLLGSLVAVIAFVTYHTVSTRVFTLFVEIIGRIYAISLLATLNCRRARSTLGSETQDAQVFTTVVPDRSAELSTVY